MTEKVPDKGSMEDKLRHEIVQMSTCPSCTNHTLKIQIDVWQITLDGENKGHKEPINMHDYYPPYQLF
jgi:hypothetical protein